MPISEQLFVVCPSTGPSTRPPDAAIPWSLPELGQRPPSEGWTDADIKAQIIDRYNRSKRNTLATIQVNYDMINIGAGPGVNTIIDYNIWPNRRFLSTMREYPPPSPRLSHPPIGSRSPRLAQRLFLHGESKLGLRRF